MTECSLGNPRKHFLKCVDCGSQTLPRNASEERPWASAAMLHIGGRVNDGALCFHCANKRRELLGVTPLENASITAEAKASTYQARLMKVHINSREVTWEIDTLESLVRKWCDQCFPKGFKNRDPRLLLVAVNNNVIRANDFTSTPISEGDEVTIVVGAIAGG